MRGHLGDRGREALAAAQDEARGLRHSYVATEHMLLGILAEGEGDATRVLESVGATLEQTRCEIAAMIGQGPNPVMGRLPLVDRANTALDRADQIRARAGDAAVEPEHLLVAMIDGRDNVMLNLLQRLDISPDGIRSLLSSIRS